MGVWDFIPPDQLHAGATGELRNGTRVARFGTVSFTRSGFARVNWQDGTVSDWWIADLTKIEDEP